MLVGLGEEVLHADQVVAIFELAALRVEGPAADVAALRDDHALGAALRHLDLGRHRVRLVLDVEDGVLGQPAHAAEQDLRVAA